MPGNERLAPHPARFRVASAIRIETRLGTVANPRWMSLLGALDGSRSITAAAKKAGLSYKAAWDAVDVMNNLAGAAVVRTTVGGSGGGGARLTARGRGLLAAWRAAEAENHRFIDRLNEVSPRAERDLSTLRRFAMQTSARNQWSGRIVRIRRGAVNDEVELELAGGERIAAVITHESLENLGFERGQEAFALVKASSVIVGKAGGRRLALSARNQLAGRVSRVTRGAVNTEVVISLTRGLSVAAIITNVAARQLRLAAGQRALAIFKASSVILGAA
jgi:molybdate transport system regulatory protein